MRWRTLSRTSMAVLREYLASSPTVGWPLTDGGLLPSLVMTAAPGEVGPIRRPTNKHITATALLPWHRLGRGQSTLGLERTCWNRHGHDGIFCQIVCLHGGDCCLGPEILGCGSGYGWPQTPILHSIKSLGSQARGKRVRQVRVGSIRRAILNLDRGCHQSHNSTV